MKFDIKTSKGIVQLDTELLAEVLERWQNVCLVAGNLCNELEDSESEFVQNFATEELSHHAVSEYTTDTQRELQDLIADLTVDEGKEQS